MKIVGVMPCLGVSIQGSRNPEEPCLESYIEEKASKLWKPALSADSQNLISLLDCARLLPNLTSLSANFLAISIARKCAKILHYPETSQRIKEIMESRLVRSSLLQGGCPSCRRYRPGSSRRPDSISDAPGSLQRPLPLCECLSCQSFRHRLCRLRF
jgi:hypothetical protein